VKAEKASDLSEGVSRGKHFGCPSRTVPPSEGTRESLRERWSGRPVSARHFLAGCLSLLLEPLEEQRISEDEITRWRLDRRVRRKDELAVSRAACFGCVGA
jgi:hypothetical protein